MNPVMAGGALLVGTGLLLAVVRWCQRRFDIHPELARKLFHIGGGVVSLTLPLLFDAVWPVVVLTLCITAALLLLRWVPALRDTLGRVTGSVSRASLGEIYFPISVGVLFAVTHRQPLLYWIPLLTLTFADSLAALIGLRYGLARYQGTGTTKSWEGSAGFFLVAFFSAHVPLLLASETGRAESLLVALILGLLIMMVEAIAWDGLDNLIVPLAAYALLRTLLALTAPELAVRLVLTLLFTAAVLWIGRRTTLITSALFGGFLAAYLIWMVCGWQWVLMPSLVFVSYRWLSPPSAWDSQRFHDVHVPFSICSAGIGWLLIAFWSERMDLFYPYTVSFTVHLAIIGVARQLRQRKESSPLAAIRSQSLRSWAVMMIAFGLVEGLSDGFALPLLWKAALAFPCVVLAVATFVGWWWKKPQEVADLGRWRWQAAAAALGSVPAAAVLFGV